MAKTQILCRLIYNDICSRLEILNLQRDCFGICDLPSRLGGKIKAYKALGGVSLLSPIILRVF